MPRSNAPANSGRSRALLRICVSLILDLHARGASIQKIAHPSLEEADILACIAYGAEMSRARYVDLPCNKSA